MKVKADARREEDRLKDLLSYKILDTDDEKDFDDLTKLASQICGTNISLISLVDKKRQWFKSSHGLDSKETPREHSFCAHAIENHEDIFIVHDARSDERFFANPLVTDEPNIVFYAGVPLVSSDGHALGTLCVIDTKPKKLSNDQLDALRALSKHAMNMMELHKRNNQLNHALLLLKNKNKDIERFASVAAHDLKLPLTTIKGYIELVLSINGMDTMSRALLEKAGIASDRLAQLIDDLLTFAKTEDIEKEQVEIIDLKTYFHELQEAIVLENQCSIEITTKLEQVTTNKALLNHTLNNLISNAIKYANQTVVKIDVEIWESPHEYIFSVADNGPGIQDGKEDLIFKPFYTGDGYDKFGNKGTGLGLSNVKTTLEKIGGSIKLDKRYDKGARFIFVLKKNAPKKQ